MSQPIKKTKKMKKQIILALLLALFSPELFAQTTAAPTINAGDTAWMIVATALVLFM